MIADRVRTVSTRTAGAVWLALRGLRSDRMRTALAVIGVALAVLSVTLLAGVGAGVAATGEDLFEEADRDLWISGGPIDIAPGTVGGFRNPVTDAHAIAAEIETHDGVRNAAPMGFQVVYVSTDGEEFDTIIGSGVPGGGSALSLEAGDGFSGPDTHHADGTYDGPMTHEAIVDPETAERYDLEVGDSIYVGGTIGNARRNEFEVVGISRTFSQFLGTGTVTIRLSELQTLTGSAADDRATLIPITLEAGADAEAVRDDLQAAYPAYDVRTNEEQFVSVLERQAVVLAGGISLVVLGVIMGAALSLNLLLSLAYAQRTSFAVMRALGTGTLTVITVAVVQAVAVTVLGTVVGLAATPILATALSSIAAAVTGFDGLVVVPPLAYVAGIVVAAGFGIVGGTAGAWRVTRSSSVEQVLD